MKTEKFEQKTEDVQKTSNQRDLKKIERIHIYKNKCMCMCGMFVNYACLYHLSDLDEIL